MKSVVITKNVNSIAIEAKKGQTFELVQEFENSFKVLVNGKIRSISKKFSKLQVEETTKKAKRGVIKTVIESLREGSKTKRMLLEILEAEFPERKKEAMLKTLNAQLGFGIKEARIEKEQGISLKVERISKHVIFFSI